MDKYRILSEYFGYSSFRDGQEKVIDAICNGQDALAIMPTGAGKSICFQVPALMKSGVSIVISPLISLMKDQVNALSQNGIQAAYINGSLSEGQLNAALLRISRGMYKIIYVAPERLNSPTFLSAISCLEVSMVCVDEAHCVSQWGQDFRPSYLLVKDFIESFETRPVVCAMTATATEKVRNDMIQLIGLKNPDITVLSFDRKNLYFSCQKPKSKPKELRRLLDLYSGRSGIVYCSSRKRTDSLFEQLSQEGYSVTKYHAGMTPHERKRNQDLFINDEKDIIIATNAFGMGIDKSNVSFVIHYNMPGDIESYYQEAGRAGRDGNKADCILLYNGSDINTQRYFIDNPEDNGDLSIKEKSFLRRTRLQKLEAMISYTKSQTCLRQYMLSYFGETAPDECGNCSVCRKAETQCDITVDAQKIMSCIARVKQKENATVVSDILLGNSSEIISKNGYDKLSTYGIMSGFSNEKLATLIEYLLSASYIDKKDGALALTPKAKDVLFGKKRITMQKEPERTPKSKIVQDEEFDKELFERLRILRKKIADKRRVPAFVIFTDATLIAISKFKPRTEEQFLEVPGVGSYKLRNFGAVFIKEICNYLDNE